MMIESTFVAMQHYNDTCSSLELGASPAELDCNPESFRTHALVDHQGSPEMDLTNVVGG